MKRFAIPRAVRPVNARVRAVRPSPPPAPRGGQGGCPPRRRAGTRCRSGRRSRPRRARPPRAAPSAMPARRHQRQVGGRRGEPQQRQQPERLGVVAVVPRSRGGRPPRPPGTPAPARPPRRPRAPPPGVVTVTHTSEPASRRRRTIAGGGQANVNDTTGTGSRVSSAILASQASSSSRGSPTATPRRAASAAERSRRTPRAPPGQPGRAGGRTRSRRTGAACEVRGPRRSGAARSSAVR